MAQETQSMWGNMFHIIDRGKTMTWDQIEGGVFATICVAVGGVITNIIRTIRGDGNERIKADINLREIDVKEGQIENAHELSVLPILNELLEKEIARSEKFQVKIDELSNELRLARSATLELTAEVTGLRKENAILTKQIAALDEKVKTAENHTLEVSLLQKEKRILNDENGRLRDEYRALNILYNGLLPDKYAANITKSLDDEVDDTYPTSEDTIDGPPKGDT